MKKGIQPCDVMPHHGGKAAMNRSDLGADLAYGKPWIAAEDHLGLSDSVESDKVLYELPGGWRRAISVVFNDRLQPSKQTISGCRDNATESHKLAVLPQVRI
jgi:hypothetical protein